MMFQRHTDRFNALNLLVELIVTLITICIFFFIKLIKSPAYSEEPITLCQWIVYFIQDLMSKILS